MSWRDWWAGLWQGMTPAEAWVGLFPAWWHLAGFLAALTGLWTAVLVAAVLRTRWEQTGRAHQVGTVRGAPAVEDELAVPLPVLVASGGRQ